MKASELIEQLQELIEQHGDLLIVGALDNDLESWIHPILEDVTCGHHAVRPGSKIESMCSFLIE